MIEGSGLEATYGFTATSVEGHIIQGTAEVDVFACMLNPGGQVPVNDVTIDYWGDAWPIPFA